MPQDNILLITTDQQRFDTINAWGNTSIFTPHLNYMAAMGTSFCSCYACCPICVPSRTTIMTGRHGYESGVVSNATHETQMRRQTRLRRTLPALLTDAGYQTCAKGKMHFEPARACYGFEQMTLPLDYMRQYDKKAETARPKVHGIGECEMEPVISTVDVKDSITTWITDQSIDFLETRDTTRPFFLWTSFTKPHPPFDPCRDFWSLYENIPMPAPVYGDWSRELEKAPQGFLAGAYENTNMHLFGPEQIAATRRAYYACITQIDYELGRLFGALRENDLFRNTWILFTSDHGEMLGDHGTFQKMLPYDGSVRIPFIMRYPDQLKAGSEDTRFIDINDILPTVLDVAGVPCPNPERLPGESIFAVDGRKDRTVEYVEHSHGKLRWISLITKSYKYNYYYGGGKEELFDLENDPDETTNLLYHAPTPEVLAVKEKLKARLTAIEAQYGLKGCVENGQFVEQEEFKPFKYHENNPPLFPKKQGGDYISLEEEVKRAVAHEDVVKLEELDIPYYEERGVLSREKL